MQQNCQGIPLRNPRLLRKPLRRHPTQTEKAPTGNAWQGPLRALMARCAKSQSRWLHQGPTRSGSCCSELY